MCPVRLERAMTKGIAIGRVPGKLSIPAGRVIECLLIGTSQLNVIAEAQVLCSENKRRRRLSAERHDQNIKVPMVTSRITMADTI